jgi:hypothetical protein
LPGADQQVGDPSPSRALSASRAVAQTVVQPGELTADLEIPTVTDHENEPEEHVRIAAKIGVFSKGG